MPVQSYEDILYDVKDHVATITLNRPRVLNALRFQSWRELWDALTRASRDKHVGVILITGSGDRAFCAGGDQNEKETDEYLIWPYAVIRTIREAPQPVIAAVNGYAIGGGHWLHVVCDVTIASDKAIFGQNGPRVGSPASGYLVSYLAGVVGEKRAREIWMFCRRYNSQQALQMGLVNAVVPHDQLMAEARRWCDELLALSPTVLKMVKTSFNQTSDHMLGQSMANVIAPDFVDTPEAQEGVNAFLEKRQPDFNQFRK